MALTGPRLLDSYSASVEYGAVILLIRERVESWLTEYERTPVAEPSVLGAIAALRALAEAYPMLASAVVGADEVQEWDAALTRWLETHGRAVRVRRGVSRDKLLAEIRREFARILAAVGG